MLLENNLFESISRSRTNSSFSSNTPRIKLTNAEHKKIAESDDNLIDIFYNIDMSCDSIINNETIKLDEKSEITSDWFKKNKDYFKFYGRDIENILAKTKIAHSRRIFCKLENQKRKISLKDLENGLKIFLKNENIKNRQSDIEFKKNMYNTLYS